MFAPSVVATANATSGGWGNIGGGLTQAVMPQIYKLMEHATGIPDSASEDALRRRRDKAWRLAMIWPGTVLLLFAGVLHYCADDSPYGNYKELHKAGQKQKTDAFKALARASCNWKV